MEAAISDLLEGDHQPLFYFLKEQVAEACGNDIDALLRSSSHVSLTSPLLLGRTAFQLATTISKSNQFRRIKRKLLADCRQVLRTNDFTQTKRDDFNRLELISSSGLSQSMFVGNTSTDLDTDERSNDACESLEKELKMLLLSVDKRRRLPKIMELLDSSLQDEQGYDLALKAILVLFNSNEPELVEKAFGFLLAQISNSRLKDRNLKVAVLLHKMIAKLPSFWNRLEALVMKNITTAVIELIASTPVHESTAANILALFATIDPGADWFKRWMHSYPCRKFVKPNLSKLSPKILTFLRNDNKEKTRGTSKSLAFLHYSCKQIHLLLYRYYCLLALNWLEYSDLYELYSTEEWIQILGFAVDFWMKRKKGSELSTILLHLAKCKNAAVFFLIPSCIKTLKKLESSIFVKIVSIACLHTNLDEIDKSLVRKEILCHLIQESSRKSQLQSFLNWKDSTWKQLLWLFASSKLQSSKESKSTDDFLLDLHNLYKEHSTEAFLKCAEHGIRVLPKEYLVVKLASHQVLIDKLTEELTCSDLSSSEEGSGRNGVLMKDSGAELNASFIVLVSVFWQPYTGVQLLRYVDCASYFRDLSRKIRITEDTGPLRKIRILTLNLDVAIELRCKANLLRKIGQCYVQWSDKNISEELEDGHDELALLLGSLMIGGPSEIQCQPLYVKEPLKTRTILKQLQTKIHSTDNDDDDNWPQSVLLKEARAAIGSETDEGIYVNTVTSRDSVDVTEPIGHPLVQYFGALLDYAYHLGITSSRKHAREQISSLRIPYFKDRDECDWFHAVLLLILRLDAQLVNSICFELYHHRNMSTFWPSANENYPTIVANKIYPLVKEIMGATRFDGIRKILKREGISSFHLLLLCCNQVYLNLLDWSNVKLYVTKSVADGPRFQAKHFCAMLLHLEEFMRQVDHRGHLLADLSRAAPLASFKYANYDAYIDELCSFDHENALGDAQHCE